MYRFQIIADTTIGESIALVGSIPELGMWDLDKCVYLSTSSDRYPLWWVDIDIPYSNDAIKIEYKYARIQEDGHGQWESPGHRNRWLPYEQTQDKTLIVDDGYIGHIQPYPYGYWQKPSQQEPLVKGKDGLKIAVLGSSVALGCSAWLLQGWAELLKETLHRKYGHQLINVSHLGANVSSTIDRFDKVVSPLEPEIVIIALSLGNEGLAYCPPHERRAVQQRFESGLQQLIKMTKELGASPILGAVYPHNEYSAEHSWLLEDTHKRMLGGDTPLLNWFDQINDGEGHWQGGLYFDAAHPNTEGHRLMYEAIDLSIFDFTQKEAAKKKQHFLHNQEIRVFQSKNGLQIFFNELDKSLRLVNTSKYEYMMIPSWLKLKTWQQLRTALETKTSLVPSMYLANNIKAKTFSLQIGTENNIETIIHLAPKADIIYLPLAHFFAPHSGDILFYDGSLAVLKPNQEHVYLVNLSDHDYNVQPMWKEVRSALRAMNPGVYIDTVNPDEPFRTMMIDQDGLESRLKVPAQSALAFKYKCPLSDINRIAILSLGDRCATRMLLHKMEFDGPAYPFDLTRTTNLSDVADIIATGFEDMWNPDFLHYSHEHGRIYHSKWSGLSFAHEVENGDDPINNIAPVHQRMLKRYSSRSQRFWYTIAQCDEILFIRTGRASREQVEDLMAKLEEKCAGKPFRLLILSEQDSAEFANLDNVIHKNIYFNPDHMYDNLDYWLECTGVMKSILDELGISSENLYWCPPKV